MKLSPEPFPPASSRDNPELARWFTEEIQPHESRLRAWLRTKFPQLRDLDDLIQEIYLKLVKAKGTGKWDRPRAYLYTTARNAALDHCRRRQIVVFEPMTGTRELSLCDDKLTVGVEAEDLAHELSMLADAIRALPDRCRQVLVLRKIHGLSHREIADRLGISHHTVNAQITAAIVKCRTYFHERGRLPPERRESETLAS